MRVYSSGELAISSGRLMLVRMLAPPREIAVWPRRVMTGTPIHRASQVVVPPT